MPTWNSRGLRGSTLEDLLNRTNEKYAHNGLALIQKIPTPITPINIDKETRHITLLLISFTHREEFYYLRFSDLEKFWNRALDGGRKSFRYEELNPAYFLPKVSGVLIPYLQVLQKDLEDRD